MKKTAVFAGGCFWCLQKVFDDTEGVLKTMVGYTGGKLKNPTYEKVSFGTTGHFEAVKVVYDDSIITYSSLLKVFWESIDPSNPDGQFCDIGSQYETAIFYSTEEEKNIATAQKRHLIKHGMDVKTKILPLGEFFEAEEYHQKYYLENPKHYRFYYENSGRPAFKKTAQRIRNILKTI